MGLTLMNEMNGKLCSCGKVHSFDSRVITGSGVLTQLPATIKQLGGSCESRTAYEVSVMTAEKV